MRTPTVLQLEAAECGAASLAMVLAYHGRYVPLEVLRAACGVSRDGSKASSILKAARAYGLEAKGLKAEPQHLGELPLPAIAFVDFCHFLVVEGYDARRVYLNDPAGGRRQVSRDEFDAMFTGVVLTFSPGEGFVRSDDRPSVRAALFARTAPVRAGIAFVFLASLALVIPGLVTPILSRIFVDNILIAGFDDWLIPLLIGMIATAAVRFGLLELQNWYLSQAETRLAVDGARQLFAHLLRLPISYFGTRYSGEIAARLDLSDGLAAMLTGDVTRTALNIVTASFFLGLMLVYSPTITLAVVAIALVNVLVVVQAARTISEGHRKLSIDRGKLSGVALAGLRDIETFKAAGAEDSFFTRWTGLKAKVASSEQEIGQRSAIFSAVPTFLAMVTAASVLILGGLEVMRGDMTIGTLVAFQTLAASFMGPHISLTMLGTTFQEVRSYTERIEDVFNQPADPAFGHQHPPSGRLPRGGIELRDVSFGYLPLEPPLIEGFSLDVPAGARVALVGASGSGKSTLGRVIAGLFKPSAGEVLIDGEPVEAWPREALASRYSYIDQEIVLFEGTVRDNLTLWDHTLPERQVVAAAQDAAIHDIISARPGTYASKVEEGGRNFSGGQRQRLEIARALVCNPRLLVLDEATSALDTVTEAQIMENIKRRGATLIIIAHRLSTIRDCDEIIVLERGKVVERGTHETLAALGGRYTHLIEA